jgi:hypothetical protein
MPLPQRRLYSENGKKVSDNSSLFYIRLRTVDPGWVRYITFASAYDDSQADRNIEFGKLVGSNYISMEGTSAGTKSIPEWIMRRTHVFRPGEVPAFRFTNATSGDVLYFYAEGYEVEVGEVITLGGKSA